jgi:hypothetical protein
MFESIPLVLFLLAGFLSFLISVAILVFGLASDQYRIINIGYKSLSVPAFFLVAAFFFILFLFHS